MTDGSRYSGLSHQELYDQLFAGNPCVVENTIAAWKSAERQADTLAGAIDRDLDRVVAGWEGAGGNEFRERVGLISTFSRDLSGDFLATHSGLSQMSTALSEAQAKAESPEETDDHDQLANGALHGAAVGAVLGPGGAVAGAFIGGIFGHNQDEEEKERARQRMVALVTGVAAQYEMADRGDWRPFAAPPTGLPQGDPTTGANPASGPRVGSPSLAPGTGPGGSGPTGTIDNPVHVAANPDLAGGPTTPGDDTVTDGTQTGSQLTGSGGGILATGPSLTGPAGSLNGVPATSGGGATGLTASTLGPGGVVGQSGRVGGGAGAPTKAAVSARATTTGPGATKAASGTGKGVAPTNKSAQALQGQRKTGASGARPGAARDEDETDERMTWLIEDDLVWRDAAEVPPPVLGGV